MEDGVVVVDGGVGEVCVGDPGQLKATINNKGRWEH